MFNQAPNKQPNVIRAAAFTGLNINNTASSRTTMAQAQATINSVTVGTANALGLLRQGDVLQFDTNDHDSLGAGTLNATTPRGNSGYVVSIPTASIRSGLCVVADAPAAAINDFHPTGYTTANFRRRGGNVQVITSGFAYIRVKANCVKGSTRLCLATAGATYLEAWTAGTVDQANDQIGANSKPFAVAMETIDTSAVVNGGLVLCQILVPFI
jgi:hypothetical protein